MSGNTREFIAVCRYRRERSVFNSMNDAFRMYPHGIAIQVVPE